jgi:hypothetical protein
MWEHVKSRAAGPGRSGGPGLPSGVADVVAEGRAVAAADLVHHDQGRRADAFTGAVGQSGVEDASFWASKASDYLRGYFHAAALGGLDLRHVARWVSGAEPGEAEDILVSHRGAARHLADQLAEMRGEANKTISTVRMTMSRSLAFLADPALEAAVHPEDGDGFDILSFLAESGTLYLIAETRGEDSPVAPSFACLANEIHYIASLAGSFAAPGGSTRRCSWR